MKINLKTHKLKNQKFLNINLIKKNILHTYIKHFKKQNKKIK